MFIEVASKLSGNLHLLCTQLCKGKKRNGNVTVKNYLNETLLSILCFIIYGQGSFEKGFDVNCQKFIELHMLCDIVWIVLFVSIFFSLKKVLVKFPVFVNLTCCVIFEFNKFPYVG